MEFTGFITEIRPIRTGKGTKGEWANVEFEVTESNPQNADYPQIGLFDLFKNGEHLKYARDFNDFFQLNDEVSVEFNLKKNEYTKKDGTQGCFYKTSAWKLEKVESANETPPNEDEGVNVEDMDDDGMPF